MKLKQYLIFLGAVLSGQLQAAFPSQDGTGSMLLYPYYTVNGGHDTLISVGNSSTHVKAIKLRFFDGKNGREMLDFNLFLGPRDVWTAALSKNNAGGVTLKTTDRSCTYPNINLSGGDLSNKNFTETNNGKIIDNTLARTTEGHIEIYEMGNVLDSRLKTALTHNSSRVPNNCDLLTEVYSNGQVDLAPAYVSAVNEPSGGLWGASTIVNVFSGTSYSVDAEAINDVHKGPQHTPPGHQNPSMHNAHPLAVVTVDDQIHTLKFSGELAGVDAISALLMRSEIYTEFIRDDYINADTNIVLSFPTRSAYTKSCEQASDAPFQNMGFCGYQESTLNSQLIGPTTLANQLDEGVHSIYNQQGKIKALLSECYVTICTEYEILNLKYQDKLFFLHQQQLFALNSKNILGSNLIRQISTYFDAREINEGWLKIDFSKTNNKPDKKLYSAVTMVVDGKYCTGVNLIGLPVIGFSLSKFVNGSVGIPPVLSNYGNSYQLKYKRKMVCS